MPTKSHRRLGPLDSAFDLPYHGIGPGALFSKNIARPRRFSAGFPRFPVRNRRGFCVLSGPQRRFARGPRAGSGARNKFAATFCSS